MISVDYSGIPYDPNTKVGAGKKSHFEDSLG